MICLGLQVSSMDVAWMDFIDMPGNRKGRCLVGGHDCGGVGMRLDGLIWLCCEMSLMR